MNRSRLDAVLRIRQIQERSARGQVATTRDAHRNAAAAEARTWRMLDERATASVIDSVAALLGQHAVVRAGMLAAQTQETVTFAAADRVETAVAAWTVAARRVEGLERLTERTAEAERDESARRVANEIDDLVLVGFAGRAS